VTRPGLFLDTGVLIAAVVTDDPHHEASAAILEGIGEGRWGRVATSDYVVAEALNFVRRKVRRMEALEAVVALAVGAPWARPVVTDLARVHAGRFAASWDAMRRHHDRGLSFTDCTSLVLCQELGLGTIATYDRGFGGLLDVVPGER
jgi:uncharacterized protein